MLHHNELEEAEGSSEATLQIQPLFLHIVGAKPAF